MRVLIWEIVPWTLRFFGTSTFVIRFVYGHLVRKAFNMTGLT